MKSLIAGEKVAERRGRFQLKSTGERNRCNRALACRSVAYLAQQMLFVDEFRNSSIPF